MSEGRLELITGPMFSGKTTELLERISSMEERGKTVRVFKPQIDKRYDEKKVVTHDGHEYSSTVISSENPHEIIEEVEGVDVVGIDEANLFTDDLMSVCQFLLSIDKIIIVSGVDKDYQANPFSPVPELSRLASKITKLTANCSKCGEDATLVQKVDGSDDVVEVGGDEKYEARCSDCHEVR